MYREIFITNNDSSDHNINFSTKISNFSISAVVINNDMTHMTSKKVTGNIFLGLSKCRGTVLIPGLPDPGPAK